MKKELKLKPIKDTTTNELSAFVNTIYNEIFNIIDNLNQEIKLENEPLHHLLLVTKLEETRFILRVFERIVEDATEYVDVKEDEIIVRDNCYKNLDDFLEAFKNSKIIYKKDVCDVKDLRIDNIEKIIFYDTNGNVVKECVLPQNEVEE